MAGRALDPLEHGSGTAQAERHADRVSQASAAMRAAPADRSPMLARSASNLFRHRRHQVGYRLDLQAFTHVLGFGDSGAWVDVEGSVTYERLADATLAIRRMPCVVPQLKTITAGGAVAGVGIEATSFRHGLVHDTMLEADVLLADGDVVTCTPSNEHRELFLALPNSYGTLGYALRLRLSLQPVQPLVRIEHRRFRSAEAFFGALAEACGDASVDAVDGVVFAADELVLDVARFVPDGPAPSDYTFERMYWRSLLERPVDHLTIRDWLWRWDTDWFWCSHRFGADRPWVRRLLGRRRLNSATYTRWMRWNARWRVAERLTAWRGPPAEAVVQDLDLPEAEAPGFLDFLLRDIRILPIWVCPIRAVDQARPPTLFPLRAGTRHVNFGVWGTVHGDEPAASRPANRRIEHEVLRLGGVKSLYSDSCFSRPVFDAAYAMERYAGVKQRYDPHGRLPDLYAKCVAGR